MRLVRSAGQNVSPSDDGRLYDQIFTDGLFTDTSFAMLGTNNVQVGAMYGDLCGRDFTIEQQTITVTLPEGAGEETGYIYVEIDTSAETPLSVGSALAPFTPTYEDINVNGAVAQMIVAEYTADAVAVVSITPVYKTVSAGGIGSLAEIETSPTKSSHAAGTYLVYDGKLYITLTSIAAGEVLTIGTNISATTAGDELSSLKNGSMNLSTYSFSLPSGWSVNYQTCKKVGKQVFLSGLLISSTGKTDKNFAFPNMVPQEIASPARVAFAGFDNAKDTPLHGIIQGRDVTFYRPETTSLLAIEFSVTYTII